jgi:hypothetical protein
MKTLRNGLWVSLLLSPLCAGAAAPSVGPVAVEHITDHATLLLKLHAEGYAAKGGISRSLTDSDDVRLKTFPHFTSSFTYKGVIYPFTMVGHPPLSGLTTHVRTLIVPLRLTFTGFGPDVIFDPDTAVDNIVHSPMFNDAKFPNGVGQFGDQMQRAAFWNKMDSQHRWHVLLDQPRVLQTLDVQVTPDVGQLSTAPDGTPLGFVADGALDPVIQAILELIKPEPDELPIFVTYNTSEFFALGYHSAYAVAIDDGTTILQTFIYTSWFDLSAVGPELSDVSTINHEIGEFLNDPYINNVTPAWNFPGIKVCGDNPFLEVGDPQGNGPNFASFPTVVIPLKGFDYHLQDLVLYEWFTGQKPSSALNGWYDYPATNQIHSPFTPCK